MPLYVLLPVIVAVGIGAVVGTRAYYNHAEKKKEKNNPLNEYTKNVEEHTRNLTDNGK